MNKQQRQTFVNGFHRWVADEFLPKEENIKKGSAEWEAHLNRLTMMVAEFVQGRPETMAPDITDPQAVIKAFAEFVGQRLGTVPVGRLGNGVSPDRRYYVWPLCLYFGVKRTGTALN